MLVKSAYTGIAASLINGKTLHVIAQIPINNSKRSQKANRKLTSFWSKKQYLIINEMSMVACHILARVSGVLTSAKLSAGMEDRDLPFGGVNVILVGDFHQFPPVGGKLLYWQLDQKKASVSLYEQFTTVVHLKQQVHVTDSIWQDVLTHVQHGNCWRHHIDILHSVTLSNPDCQRTDFSACPWEDAVLITPQHSVRRHWNDAMSKKRTKQNKTQLFVCQAYDTFQGHTLTVREHLEMARNHPRQREGKNREHGGLPDELTLSVGMNVIITINVQTDLDVANGSWGKIIAITLQVQDKQAAKNNLVVKLTQVLAYVLVKMERTKVPTLAGLSENVIPLTAAECTFSLIDRKQKKKILRK